MSDPSRQDLIALAQRGDMDALGTLYDQNYKAIFGYFWLRVRDRQLAEDLTGEVFLRMLDALPRYRALGAPFRAWLFRIAHNLLIDQYRETGGGTLVSLEEADRPVGSSDDVMGELENRLSLERIKRALPKLDPVQRDIVSLRFLSGLSVHEVATILSMSESAIKSAQHRALGTLRLALAQE